MSSDLPILGGPTAYSAIDCSWELQQTYLDCQTYKETETTASAFAEAFLDILLKQANNRREEEGLPRLFARSVSQQPPDGSKRRVDLVLRSFTPEGRSFILACVEVKRHKAPPSETDLVEAQVLNAILGTSQHEVYAIAFHGTALRLWHYQRPVFRSLIGTDTGGYGVKSDWMDTRDHRGSIQILGLFYNMLRSPPFPLVREDMM